jgi:hypothetical protein
MMKTRSFVSWAPSASVLAQAGLTLEDAVRGVSRTRSVADRIEELLRHI